MWSEDDVIALINLVTRPKDEWRIIRRRGPCKKIKIKMERKLRAIILMLKVN